MNERSQKMSTAEAQRIMEQLWFRNTCSWGYDATSPELSATELGTVIVRHEEIGDYHWYAEGASEFVLCDNATNVDRL